MKAQCSCGLTVRVEQIRTPDSVKSIAFWLCNRCDTRVCKKCKGHIPRDDARCPKCGRG